jgi:hypothetical protein
MFSSEVWKRRFVFLPRGQRCLYFFDQQTDERPKQLIEFGADCMVQRADEYVKDCDWSFGLFHPNGKIFFLCADTQSERDAWIAVISEAVAD